MRWLAWMSWGPRPVATPSVKRPAHFSQPLKVRNKPLGSVSGGFWGGRRGPLDMGENLEDHHEELKYQRSAR